MLHIFLTEQEIKQYPEASFNSIPHLLVETVNMKSSFWPQPIEPVTVSQDTHYVSKLDPPYNILLL